MHQSNFSIWRDITQTLNLHLERMARVLSYDIFPGRCKGYRSKCSRLSCQKFSAQPLQKLMKIISLLSLSPHLARDVVRLDVDRNFLNGLLNQKGLRASCYSIILSFILYLSYSSLFFSHFFRFLSFFLLLILFFFLAVTLLVGTLYRSA